MGMPTITTRRWQVVAMAGNSVIVGAVAAKVVDQFGNNWIVIAAFAIAGFVGALVGQLRRSEKLPA
jgi:hypothetical protein